MASTGWPLLSIQLGAIVMFLALCMLNIALSADPEPAVEDSITVTVVGTLRTGIIAIGGETTGTTITSKGVTWELDLGENADFRETADGLDGKKVRVEGTLERRKGIEVRERWIVTVTRLSEADAATPLSEADAATP